MSVVPSQVAREAEEAERIVQSFLAAPPPDQTDQTAQREDTQSSTEATSSTPPASEPPKPDEGAWEQRYKTLQGMFQAETSRREARARELEQQLQGAFSRISELEQATRKPNQAEPSKPLVTDSDVETFGGDLIDLVKRQAQEVIQSAARDMEGRLTAKDVEIAKLREQLGGVAEQTKAVTQNTYLSELTKLVPDWEAVNTNQGFLDWLAQTDPLTGLQRQSYLDDAFGKLDVRRTAEIFSAYRALTGTRPQPTSTGPQIELQRQVQPSSTQATPATTGADNGTKIWSVNEIDQFYRDVARGFYAGKDGERQRLNTDIDLAISQGRLRA
jgi:hypothetical protein